MSTWAASEQALLDTIRLMPAFGPTTTSRGDFRVWDAPGEPVGVVILKAGRSEYGDRIGNRGSHGKRQQRHRLAAIVGRKRGQADDGTAYVALTEAVDALVAHLDIYPRLHGQVRRAEVVEVGEVQRRRDAPYVYCAVLLDVFTETAPALVETSQ